MKPQLPFSPLPLRCSFLIVLIRFLGRKRQIGLLPLDFSPCSWRQAPYGCSSSFRFLQQRRMFSKMHTPSSWFRRSGCSLLDSWRSLWGKCSILIFLTRYAKELHLNNVGFEI